MKELRQFCSRINNINGAKQNNIIKIIFLLNKNGKMRYKDIEEYIPQSSLSRSLKYCLDSDIVSKIDRDYSIKENYKIDLSKLKEKYEILNCVLTNNLAVFVPNLYRIMFFICCNDGDVINLKPIMSELRLTDKKLLKALNSFEDLNIHCFEVDKKRLLLKFQNCSI